MTNFLKKSILKVKLIMLNTKLNLEMLQLNIDKVSK